MSLINEALKKAQRTLEPAGLRQVHPADTASNERASQTDPNAEIHLGQVGNCEVTIALESRDAHVPEHDTEAAAHRVGCACARRERCEQGGKESAHCWILSHEGGSRLLRQLQPSDSASECRPVLAESGHRTRATDDR